jgi:hypothetical protein
MIDPIVVAAVDDEIRPRRERDAVGRIGDAVV